MEPSTENAIRAVARRCRSEIIDAIKDQPKPQHDPIITKLLDKYAAQIQCLPPDTFRPKDWLVYYVRVIDKESRGTA